MRWSVVDGPIDVISVGDAVMCWAWVIERAGEKRTVRVSVSSDVIGARDVAMESQLAASLRGRSAVDKHLEEADPPLAHVITKQGLRTRR